MTDTHWTLTIADDIKVCVPPDILLMTTYVLLEQEDWFEAELRFLRELILPGMGILDIGANHGLYALSLAKRLNGKGRVLACEPSTSPSEMLERSIIENDLGSVLTLLRVGLSNFEGQAELSIGSNSELNSLKSSNDTPAGQTETIRVTTLDALLASGDWPADFRVDILKLDAEGEEIRILHGGKRFLCEQDPLVLFEWKHGKELNTGLVEVFTSIGYEIYRLIPGLNCLIPVKSGEVLDGYQLNLFACKPSRADRLRSTGNLLNHSDLNRSAYPLVRGWSDVLGEYDFVRAIRSDENTITAWKTLNRTYDLHWPAYQQALDFYLNSTVSTEELPKRYAWLRSSLEQLDALNRVGDNHLATDFLRIRVLEAAGQRTLAVQINSQLVELLSKNLPMNLDRPFIPPLADYEGRPPKEKDIGSWLVAATIEGLEVRRAFSSYFYPNSQLVQLVSNNPNRSRQMDRRRALLALHAGKDVKIASQSMLRGPFGLDHRNVDWWRQLPLPDGSPSIPILPHENGFLIDLFALDLHVNPIRIVDVGAATHGSYTEPYASLIKADCVRVLGFEPDQSACDELNKLYASDSKYRYLPLFVGDGKPAVFYETNWSMTGSLFKPNKQVLESFEQLGEVVALKAIHPVNTVRLGDLQEAFDIDMIKIDVQGAELSVFEGVDAKLSEVLVIWTEVEFIPLYENQPLFRDIDSFLSSKGFLLHCFDGIESRRFKPYVRAGGRLRPRRQQAIWADAIFVRDFRTLNTLSSMKLKKFALLLDQVVGAVDLCFTVLQILDERNGTNYASDYLARNHSAQSK